MISKTSNPPYYAVVFTSIRTDGENGYNESLKNMLDLVKNQKGFLGVESARENLGITVSYWESLDAIKNWKSNYQHIEVQEKGKNLWYKSFKVRICKIEKDYDFKK